MSDKEKIIANSVDMKWPLNPPPPIATMRLSISVAWRGFASCLGVVWADQEAQVNVFKCSGHGRRKKPFVHEQVNVQDEYEE